MICVKCGHMNPGDSKYCEKCNAVLLRVLPPQASTTMVDVEEGFAYLSPEQMYITSYIFQLVQAGYNYCTGEGTREELAEVYGDVKKRFEDFDQRILPDMLAELES